MTGKREVAVRRLVAELRRLQPEYAQACLAAANALAAVGNANGRVPADVAAAAEGAIGPLGRLHRLARSLARIEEQLRALGVSTDRAGKD